VSEDLRSWVRVGDVVAASEPPAFDDLATWTGSVVRDRDGRWWLFNTGVTLVDAKIRQTIGAATSIDLMVWHKEAASPLVTADGRWYERLGGGDRHVEAWCHDRAGQPMLLAFLYFDQARQFLGELSDPMPVGWENGVLKVTRTVEV
jgi:hypothetical protein